LITDPVRLLTEVAEILERCGVPYAVGGSVASSRYGEFRATNDIDIGVDLTFGTLRPLHAALAGKFYVDFDAMLDAFQRASSFSVIHLELVLKIDFFVLGQGLFERSMLARRAALTLSPDAARAVAFVSAEDIILQKLRWYRLSEGALERQLRDVAGVYKLQGARLDLAYMRRMATSIGLSDLLEKSLRDAGLPG